MAWFWHYNRSAEKRENKMLINEDLIAQTGRTKTEQTESNDLFIIEDKNDPDMKLLKKKIKIKPTIKNMKGILV